MNRRILIVDDTQAIHDDFRKILAASETASDLNDLESSLFGPSPPVKQPNHFVLGFAHQGEEALGLVQAAKLAGYPYAMAFVDMRMPPGWDGLETICRLWEEDPLLQVVICSAYADYSWSDLAAKLKSIDSLLILKKPFDTIEVIQLAHALTHKWKLLKESQQRQVDLEASVAARTEQLASANEALRKEMTERQQVELSLRLAQKLESVGRLAAGVAHEINTPVQFVNDSVHFIREGVQELTSLIGHYRESSKAVLSGAAAQKITDAEEEVDLPYLLENLPGALDRSLDGLARIATIVRSMKEFAHPDQSGMSEVDLNRAIESTLTLARNEYKYVAEVKTELGELPKVCCHGGEVNQVVLNLLVNAAHAIGDVVKGTDQKGLITVRSRVDGGMVEIAITDTGGGIPEAIRGKIFDPFFTTKEVGRGTGQGLAIARSVVHDKHGGDLTFETELGRGTTFFIRLPLGGKEATRAA